jgi:tetratricopeptide (TPR) repeat protein
MAIRGSLADASLEDVLQLLALGQKTGCLTVRDGERFGYIYFDSGVISFASTVGSRERSGERLGDLLEAAGLATAEQIADAVRAQELGSGRRLGQILLERGTIEASDLERVVRQQVEEAIYDLFTWTEGAFAFTPGQRPMEGEILLRIATEAVLLEGARRVDEWGVIERKIPTLDLVFARFAGGDGTTRGEPTADQRRVLPLVDGRRSVRDIVEQSGLNSYAAAKALLLSLESGLLRQVGRRGAFTRNDPPPPAVERHRNLALALYRTRRIEEAETELDKLLRLAPGDVAGRFHLALVELRTHRSDSAIARLRELAEEGHARGAALVNIALALEGRGRLEDALLALDRAAEVLGNAPAVLLSRAVVLGKLGRMDQAAELFRAYRGRMGDAHRAPAVYYAFAMLAEAARGDLRFAQVLAEEGVRHFPRASPVLLHAGAVYERSGQAEEAEALVRRAVLHDPRSTPCRRALARLLEARGALEQAATEYDRLVELESAAAEPTVCRLAEIRYRLGQRQEAVRLWRRALELNPASELARTSLELIERSRTA